jgi:dipeptidyl aminopeptidase/acylaminoacyl peptidase
MKNRFILTAFCLTLYIFTAHVLFAQNADDGKILEREKYQFAPFEMVQGLEKIWSKQEYTEAVGDAAFEMERLKYSSDGLAVVAYLYKLKDTKNKKYPAIIFNRGGYIRGNIGYELAPFFHRLAQAGFVIIAPLYRASDGARGKDEVGGADMDDLMNIAPLAKSLDFVDAKNLFLYGESRGGMMCLQAVRNNFPANAAATFGAFTDFDALVNAQPKLYQPLVKAIWTDFDARKDEIIRQRSAIYWADKINTPLLLMHGGADQSVDPLQTLNLALALQKLGKSYELMIYNGDSHILIRNQKDRDARALAWFQKHLKQ